MQRLPSRSRCNPHRQILLVKGVAIFPFPPVIRAVKLSVASELLAFPPARRAGLPPDDQPCPDFVAGEPPHAGSHSLVRLHGLPCCRHLRRRPAVGPALGVRPRSAATIA